MTNIAAGNRPPLPLLSEVGKLGYNGGMGWHLIGHQWATDLLKRHLVTGEVCHAYLITGPEEVGKTTLALKFAQALNCQAPPQPGEVCGGCRACRLIPAMAYPDLHVLEAEQVGGTVKVEEIRLLQHQLALSPYEGKWRLAVLPGFHQATASAANALLKTLEEPPHHVVLLLTAPSPEALLPTIVSRCEIIPLRLVPGDEVEAALLERIGDPDGARLLTGLAGGRPGRALRLATDADQLRARSGWVDDLMSLLQQGPTDRFRYVEKLTQGKDADEKRGKSDDILGTWLAIWRDALLTCLRSSAPLGNPDRREDVSRLASEFSAQALAQAVRDTERTLAAIADHANLRLALETLMLDLPRFGPARQPAVLDS